MAAAAILNLLFLSILVKCSISGGSPLHRAVASILRSGVLNKAVPSAEGASRIEAPNAPRGVGCVPLSTGGRVWGEGSPPPQKIFDILESKWRIFVDSLVLNFAFLYDQNSKKYTRNAWTAMEIDLHAIKSVVYCLLLLTFTQT